MSEAKPFNPYKVAARIMNKHKVTGELRLISDSHAPEGKFLVGIRSLTFNPVDADKIEAIVKAYDEIRSSPLYKALE